MKMPAVFTTLRQLCLYPVFIGQRRLDGVANHQVQLAEGKMSSIHGLSINGMEWETGSYTFRSGRPARSWVHHNRRCCQGGRNCCWSDGRVP